MHSSRNEADAYLQSVFDTLEKGVWEFDQKRKTRFANQWLCEYLGYTKEEFKNLNPFFEIKKASDRPLQSESLLDYFGNLSPWIKHRFLSKEGRVKFLSLKVAMRPSDNDQGSFFLLCSTRYQDAEQRVHFEAIQTMGSIGVWELDPVTGQTSWSSEVYHIYGLEVGTPTDKIQGINFYAEEDRPRIQKDVERALKGIPYRNIYRFFDATGTEKLVEAMGQPVFDDNGQVALVRGTFQDVTERVRREKDLSLVLNNINEGYWDWHVARDYEYMSPRFWEILGYDPASKKPHPSEWQKLVHPEDLPKILSAFEQHVKNRGQERFTADIRYKHGAGHWLWIRCEGKVVEWGAQGQPLRVVGTHQDVTEELNLMRENQSFLTALKSTMLISKTDVEGKITYANDLFFEVSQYTQAELIGQNHRIVNSGYHNKDYFKGLWTTLKNKEIFRGEIRNRAKDGRFYWVDAVIVPFLGPDGEIKEFISFMHIVTDKKEAELKLQESSAKISIAKERLELAIEGANLGTWNWDLLTNKVIFDERWAQLRGARFEALTQTYEDWRSRVHPEDLKRAEQDIADYLEGKSSIYSNLHRVKHSDGRWRYILGRGRFAEWDEKGRPIRFIGTDMDLTPTVQRDQVTQVVSELRLKYIDLQGNRNEFFEYVLRTLTKYFDCNYGFVGEIRRDADGSPFLKMFGITDFVWDKVVEEDYDPNSDRGFEVRDSDSFIGDVVQTGRAMVTNSPKSHAKRIGLPPGHPPVESFMAVPIYYNNQLLAVVGLANRTEGFQDELVPENKAVFDSLGEMFNSLRLNAEIEAQRRYTMHNAKLASIGEMAAGVGHEINNPLAIIVGQLSVMKKHAKKSYPEDTVIPERIQKSQKAVDRIANIVQGLRSFSRSDQDSSQVFCFSDLAKETADMLVEVYRSEEVSLEVEVQDGLWTAGNRGRWQQVLVNLLNNARDAVRTVANKSIHLRTLLEKDKIIVKVKDCGVGIPDKLREKIYEPFFTTKEVNEGTGIGLALSNTIVQEHGGRIYLESALGAGTEFTIELKSSPAPEGEPIRQPSGVAPTPSTRSWNILVVDDEEDLREGLEGLLKEAGYKVTLASDGAKAFETLTKSGHEFDVILSDIKMEKLDGIGLIKKIKAETNYKGLCILITGGVQTDSTALDAKVDGFLMKPFNEADVLNMLQSKLKRLEKS